MSAGTLPRSRLQASLAEARPEAARRRKKAADREKLSLSTGVPPGKRAPRQCSLSPAPRQSMRPEVPTISRNFRPFHSCVGEREYIKAHDATWEMPHERTIRSEDD